MKKHLAAMAKEHDALKKSHEAAAACEKELSACYKSDVAEGLRKATEKRSPRGPGRLSHSNGGMPRQTRRRLPQGRRVAGP